MGHIFLQLSVPRKTNHKHYLTTKENKEWWKLYNVNRSMVQLPLLEDDQEIFCTSLLECRVHKPWVLMLRAIYTSYSGNPADLASVWLWFNFKR